MGKGEGREGRDAVGVYKVQVVADDLVVDAFAAYVVVGGGIENVSVVATCAFWDGMAALAVVADHFEFVCVVAAGTAIVLD